jgi:hypothetical protein
MLKKDFEGKCCIDGYVKKGSSKIITYSCGNIYGNIAVFTIVFEYMVCNPPNGMRISCVVSSITNAGIMALANNMEVSPVNVFIARDHHYNIPYFSQLKNDDVIMVRVIGQRFELNDTSVFIIAELEEEIERLPPPSQRVGLGSSIKSKLPEKQLGKQDKSPLSIIAEESQGMMKNLFSSGEPEKKQGAEEGDAEGEAEGEAEEGDTEGEEE